MNKLIIRISNLFKKFGIKSITMDDMSYELGISKKTLYQHFKNKNDVVKKVTEFEFNSDFTKLENICNSNINAIEQLLSIVKFLINELSNLNPSLIYDLKKYYPEIWNDLIVRRKSYIKSLLKQNFQTGIKQGVYHKNMNIEIMSSVYSLGLDINSFELYYNEFKENLEEMVETLFIYYLRGIANDIGIKHLQQKYKL